MRDIHGQRPDCAQSCPVLGRGDRLRDNQEQPPGTVEAYCGNPYPHASAEDPGGGGGCAGLYFPRVSALCEGFEPGERQP